MKTIKQKFIIDESSSMDRQTKTVIDGFNEQLDEMAKEQKESGVRYLVSLTTFASSVKHIFTDVPLEDVEKLNFDTYKPYGSTAMYDAIGSVIETATIGETDVIVTIMTDGMENNSYTWNQAKINALISIREKENKWGFVYFGSNQDAWQAAQSMGISNSVNYTDSNTGPMMRSMSMSRNNYVGCALADTYDTSNLMKGIDQASLVK